MTEPHPCWNGHRCHCPVGTCVRQADPPSADRLPVSLAFGLFAFVLGVWVGYHIDAVYALIPLGRTSGGW